MTAGEGGHGRLRRGADIAAVLGGRHQRAGELVAVHAVRRAPGGPDHPRVAVIASRRVGAAVQRNRAKRLLREAARRLPLRAEVDLVLVARPACAAARLDAVLTELRMLADALGLLTTSDATAGAAP